ncbi:MAG TPA: T9SS C-terminal target domain-containing protein [Bacteroidia bacterium]|nr:T9SS C-terminal target domain-containing protein [Bacteroidia bacterium]HNT79636.1 T9SS C-terminal target domain-containing protein [Bacteroidia bacterium]
MKKVNLIFTLMITLAALVTVSSCKKDEDDPAPSNTSTQVIEVSSNITANTTWTANQKYLLKGFIFVTNGATLTIEPGTIIKGDKNSKGTLIVDRGSKLIAEGTATNPIVFTSNQPKGQRDYGDWGGIIVCGKAPVNLPNGEGIVEGGTGATFGGTIANDNSGILKYVRIEFPGIPFQPNQEINGLTLAGVGSATQISYIQVSYSGDDSYEFFGGSGNASHIVAFRGWDDDFDTDNGFSGKIQFGVSLRDPNIADQSGSNSFESDNDGQGTSATPVTNAIFSNMSIFGPLETASSNINSLYKRGAHLRRNTKQNIFNSVISGFPTGLLVDGSSTISNANNDELNFRNNVIAGCSTPLSTTDSTFHISTWHNNPMFSNTILSATSDLGIVNGYSLNNPNFLPNSTSILLTGADFSHPNLSGMTQVNYRGAFGNVNWTSGWCNWDPQNTDY